MTFSIRSAEAISWLPVVERIDFVAWPTLTSKTNNCRARQDARIWPWAFRVAATPTVVERTLPGPTPVTAFWRLANWVGIPRTLTVNEVDTGLLVSSESLTEQLTVVVPMANVEPEAGAQLGVGGVVSSGS